MDALLLLIPQVTDKHGTGLVLTIMEALVKAQAVHQESAIHGYFLKIHYERKQRSVHSNISSPAHGSSTSHGSSHSSCTTCSATPPSFRERLKRASPPGLPLVPMPCRPYEVKNTFVHCTASSGDDEDNLTHSAPDRLQHTPPAVCEHFIGGVDKETQTKFDECPKEQNDTENDFATNGTPSLVSQILGSWRSEEQPIIQVIDSQIGTLACFGDGDASSISKMNVDDGVLVINGWQSTDISANRMTWHQTEGSLEIKESIIERSSKLKVLIWDRLHCND